MANDEKAKKPGKKKKEDLEKGTRDPNGRPGDDGKPGDDKIDPTLPPGRAGAMYYTMGTNTVILLAILYYIFFCGCCNCQ